jgi:hypothetical protein
VQAGRNITLVVVVEADPASCPHKTYLFGGFMDDKKRLERDKDQLLAHLYAVQEALNMSPLLSTGAAYDWARRKGVGRTAAIIALKGLEDAGKLERKEDMLWLPNLDSEGVPFPDQIAPWKGGEGE